MHRSDYITQRTVAASDFRSNIFC